MVSSSTMLGEVVDVGRMVSSAEDNVIGGVWGEGLDVFEVELRMRVVEVVDELGIGSWESVLEVVVILFKDELSRWRWERARWGDWRESWFMGMARIMNRRKGL